MRGSVAGKKRVGARRPLPMKGGGHVPGKKGAVGERRGKRPGLPCQAKAANRLGKTDIHSV